MGPARRRRGKPLKIAILGVGLIGGSIGLAARARAGARVCGYDPDPHACAMALELGALDSSASSVAEAVADAEVVFAATPLGALAETVSAALVHAGPNCVISDVGSTKLTLEGARTDPRADLRADPRFIGGHPLAGAETAGVGSARADLFAGAIWYLTPTPATDPALYERLCTLIASLGARPQAVDASAHDHLMACISHLPHVLANLLAAQATAAFEREGSPPSANPSLRDAIRVAGANSAIWTDIYLANRPALLGAIDELNERLAATRATLDAADTAALRAWQQDAAAQRARLLGEDSQRGARSERERPPAEGPGS